MRIELIPQVELGKVDRMRIGDVLNGIIADPNCQRFRFTTAYMRVSGLDRLSASIDTLLNRGGEVAGIVGVDDGITSIEALDLLRRISSDSTIFHTVTGYIYHPKLYIAQGHRSATVVMGSGNLTRDGLFRNVEVATSIHLDFRLASDLEIFKRYDGLIDELLDPSHPNVQLITPTMIQTLAGLGVIQSEAKTSEPGPHIRSKRAKQAPDDLQALFPPLSVPVAPPLGRAPSSRASRAPQTAISVSPASTNIPSMFVMQLSPFDSSHRTGVSGTAEVLIPRRALRFFPDLSLTERKYPDALFDVVLNTPLGRERHRFRLWYYEQRATGTRIDEYRLRMDHGYHPTKAWWR